MKLLLDAHTFLWFINADNRLSAVARSLIENPNNESVVSAATLWEIAIKASLGRLRLTLPFDQLMSDQLERNGFQVLEIQNEHLRILVDLPFHHRDPFDRLLVAQAIAEKIAIVSADVALDAYDVKRLW